MVTAVVRNRVLVRQDPKKDRIGTLFVPQGKEEWPPIGTVVLVGPTAFKDHADEDKPQIGDRVLFKRHPARALVPDNREPGERGSDREDLLVLDDEDILAIVEEA